MVVVGSKRRFPFSRRLQTSSRDQSREGAPQEAPLLLYHSYSFADMSAFLAACVGEPLSNIRVCYRPLQNKNKTKYSWPFRVPVNLAGPNLQHRGLCNPAHPISSCTRHARGDPEYSSAPSPLPSLRAFFARSHLSTDMRPCKEQSASVRDCSPITHSLLSQFNRPPFSDAARAQTVQHALHAAVASPPEACTIQLHPTIGADATVYPRRAATGVSVCPTPRGLAPLPRFSHLLLEA